MQPVFWAAASVSAVAAVVMVCMLKYQHFHGKRFYGLTFIGMIWTLITVGAEASNPSFSITRRIGRIVTCFISRAVARERERKPVPASVCETSVIGWTPQEIFSTWSPTRGKTEISPRIIRPRQKR